MERMDAIKQRYYAWKLMKRTLLLLFIGEIIVQIYFIVSNNISIGSSIIEIIIINGIIIGTIFTVNNIFQKDFLQEMFIAGEETKQNMISCFSLTKKQKYFII